MDQAVNESNGKLLKDVAHKFKGSLATLGWYAAAGVAFELETLGRKGEVSGAVKFIDTLRETYQVSELHTAVTNYQ
jgi:HPt (histidine-containing phosphotransfer) domain-containing protein